MGRRLDLLGEALIGGGSSVLKHELALLSDVILRRQPVQDNDIEILPARYFEERIGRNGRVDLVGEDDFDEDDDAGYIGDEDDDDDEEGGYIGMADIIGAMHAASIGKRLTHKQRKAIRVAAKSAKKAAKRKQRAANDGDSNLMNAMRAASRPLVRTDEENILRMLNLPLSSITVAANSTNSFLVVVQESIRIERLFLYPVGGNYDNLWVGDMFAGRQCNSVVPGNEEPMIFYSNTSVNAAIEGFTVAYGLTLRLLIRNGTGAPVIVGGKIKGKTLTT